MKTDTTDFRTPFTDAPQPAVSTGVDVQIPQPRRDVIGAQPQRDISPIDVGIAEASEGMRNFFNRLIHPSRPESQLAAQFGEKYRTQQTGAENILTGAVAASPYMVPVAGQAYMLADLLSRPKDIPEFAKSVAQGNITVKEALYGKGLGNAIANIFRPGREGDPEAQEQIRRYPVKHAFDVGIATGAPKLVRGGVRIGKQVKAVRTLGQPRVETPAPLKMKKPPQLVKPQPKYVDVRRATIPPKPVPPVPKKAPIVPEKVTKPAGVTKGERPSETTKEKLAAEVDKFDIGKGTDIGGTMRAFAVSDKYVLHKMDLSKWPKDEQAKVPGLFTRGRPIREGKSKTDMPVLIDKHIGGDRPIVLDGWHRIGEALERGDKTIDVYVGEGAIKDLAEYHKLSRPLGPEITPKMERKLERAKVVPKDVEPPKPPIKPTKPVDLLGETKESKLAVRAEADAIEAKLTKDFGDLPEYKTMNMKDQANRAKKVLDTDYEKAKQMAMGEETVPQGIRPASIYEAVKLRALKEGDVETLHKLATESKLPTRLSELGQEIKAADSRLMDDPVRAMQDIGKGRQERAKKTSVKKVAASVVEKLSKELNATKKAYDELLAKKAVKRRPIQYGAKNKLVTTDVYNKALGELRLATDQLNINVDPGMVANLGKVGAYHFEAGSRAFAQWSGRMLEDTGDWAKPQLAKLWAEMEAKRRQAIGLKSNKTRLANQIEKFTDKLNNLDFEKIQRRKTVFDPEARALKSKYEQARRNYQAAADASGAVTKTEAAKIVKLSRDMELKKDKIDAGGDRLEYGAAKVKYVNYINALKGEGESLGSMARGRAREFRTTWRDNKAEAVYNLGRDAVRKIIDMSVSMVGSWDNSFLGRQGLHTLQTHPSQWFPAAKKSFSDIVKTLGGKDAHNALMADIYSRKNYINGNYQKAKILARTEEQFPTSLPGRVPGFGRVFKASEYAFTGSAMRMRTGLFDLLHKRAKANDVIINDAWLESHGKMINSLTARGQWGKKGDPPFIRLILWAPKMLKANIDVLTAHGAGMALKHPGARKEAAINLLKIVGETATVMMIANALKPGSAEYDPRSSDFGDIKIGKTRFDITGGASSIVTLAARIAPVFIGKTAKTKDPVTGEIREYGTGFGQKSPFDAMIDFLANKTNPPARVLVDALRGRHYDYTPFEVKKSVYGATTPISIQQAISLKDNASADAVAGVIADWIGVSAHTFEDRKRGKKPLKPRKPLKELKRPKD